MTGHIVCSFCDHRLSDLTRTRSRSVVAMDSYLNMETNNCYPWGACWASAGGYPHRRSVMNYDYMIDQEGDRKTPNPAISTRISYTGGGWNLSGSAGAKRIGAVNYIPLAWTSWFGSNSFPTPPSGAFTGQPSDNNALIEALAVSNPAFGKNDVLLPVSILELRELPKIVWDRASRRKQTNSAVEYNFGWAPLLSDIRKLFMFPDTVEKRIKTLRSLAEGASHRHVDVYRAHAFQNYPERSVESGWYPVYPIAKSAIHLKWERSLRVSVAWESTLPPQVGDAEYAKTASRFVLGLDPSQIIQGAWELLPWSWLTDYFFNISSLLQANNWSVGRPTNCSISQVDKCWATEVVTAGPPKTGKPFVTQFRRWQRRPLAYTPILPDLEMPILSASQITTLASIAFNSR